MDRFKRILFVGSGKPDGNDALRQALSLAKNNQAVLTLLLSYPELPGAFTDYKVNWEQALINEAATTIRKLSVGREPSGSGLSIEYHALGMITPATQVIQKVLQDGYDLLIKNAESTHSKNG